MKAVQTDELLEQGEWWCRPTAVRACYIAGIAIGLCVDLLVVCAVFVK